MQKLDLSYYCTICNLRYIEYTGVTKESSMKLIIINILSESKSDGRKPLLVGLTDSVHYLMINRTVIRCCCYCVNEETIRKSLFPVLLLLKRSEFKFTINPYPIHKSNENGD